MNATLTLARRYATGHPFEAAQRLGGLASDQVAFFLDDLEPEVAVPVLKEFWPGFSGRVLEHLEADRAARLIENLDLTRLVVLLFQLPDASRERIISALPHPLEQRARHAISLPEGTAGATADSTVIPYDADVTVSAVLDRGLDIRLPYLYVVDGEHRLAGVLHRRDLDGASGSATLRSIMTTKVQSIASSDSLVAVLDHAAWASLDALPVVDDRGAFFGVLRHKTLRTTPSLRRVAPGPTTAVSTLLDLGEAYWSGLFSAIEGLASIGSDRGEGDHP